MVPGAGRATASIGNGSIGTGAFGARAEGECTAEGVHTTIRAVANVTD